MVATSYRQHRRRAVVVAVKECFMKANTAHREVLLPLKVHAAEQVFDLIV